MSGKTYQWCVVSGCKNTSKSTPEKLFIYVPKQSDTRKKWLQLAKRNCEELSAKSSLYFCEDHFDLPNDMENYIQYMLMGVKRVIMKKGCLPKKFECQVDRKRTSATIMRRPVGLKRRRLELIKEAENYLKVGSSKTTAEDTPTKEPITPIEHSFVDKCVQVNIPHKFRSKSTQCHIKVQDIAVSPFKLNTKNTATSPVMKVNDCREKSEPSATTSPIIKSEIQVTDSDSN